MTEYPLDSSPFPTDLASSYQDPLGSSGRIANNEPAIYQAPNSAPLSLNTVSYDSYHPQELNTLDQSILEPASLLLNDSGVTEESSNNPDGQLDLQPDMSTFSNLGQSEAVTDLRPSPLPHTSKRSTGSLTINDEHAKLIDGQEVLRLLFKYISKPTMEDIENIAKDTGYFFEFVIDSYCHYRKSARTDWLTSNEFAIVDQSKRNPRTSEYHKAGLITNRLGLWYPDSQIGHARFHSSYQA